MNKISEAIKEMYRNQNDEKMIVELLKNRFEKCNYKIYKYCPADKNCYFKNLRKDNLYFNSIESFNDPFECILTCSNLFINSLLYQSINSIPQANQLFAEISLIIANSLIDSIGKDEKETKEKLVQDLFDYLQSSAITKSINPTKCDLECMLNVLGTKSFADGDFYGILKKFAIETNRNVNLKNFKEKISNVRKNVPSAIKKDISSRFKLTCFSEVPNNILMWSHYANKHQGFVVEYDLKEIFKNEKLLKRYLEVLFLFFKVEYIDKMPDIPSSLIYLNNKMDYISDALEMIYQKNKCWKYEKEWRSVIMRDASSEVKFIKASKVIVGANASENTINKLKSICQKKDIKLKKYIMNTRTYSLKQVNID